MFHKSKYFYEFLYSIYISIFLHLHYFELQKINHVQNRFFKFIIYLYHYIHFLN